MADAKGPTSSETGAYEHHDSVTGATPQDTPFAEHRDTAAVSPNDTNEIDLERRREADKHHGPETHQATRVARKDGA